MSELTTTVTKEEKRTVIICDFCKTEMNYHGCCGHTDWARCSVCGKHMCKKCRNSQTIETDWGDGPDWTVNLCPVHATKEIIDRTLNFIADRVKAANDHSDYMEKIQKDFYDWLSSKKEAEK